MARVSVVILNYNGKNFLEKFLPTIIKFSPDCEIIVADNGSADGSLQYLRNHFPDVKSLDLHENHGFCKGYNLALSHVDSEYSVIINSDVEVTENWLNPIINLMDNDPRIAAIQPKLLDFHMRDKFEYAGGAGGFIDKYGYPFCRGRIFDTIETDSGQYDDTREIFWATGAAFIIRTDLFRKYGGFDEDFFAHMEEIDLCWRMKQDGYKVFYCGDSYVFHVGGGTLDYSNPRKTYLNFRNSMMVLIKNLPSGQLIWKLPVRWLIDYVAVMKFILTGEFKNALKIIQAHFYILSNLNRNLKKRKNVQRGHLEGVYRGFLLIDYHLKRRRKFSDLHFK